MQKSVLRLIDANGNRALEGLRVCEEITRLHFNNAPRCRDLRLLRHGVAVSLKKLPISRSELLAARDSRKDVGNRAPSGSVLSLEQLLVINFQRAKEALRTLEECCRIASPRAAAAFQALRFKAYAAERETLLHVAAVRHR